MGLTLEDKLAGFPVVNYINLIESTDRKEYMESQARKYSLDFIRFPIVNHYKSPSEYKAWREYPLNPSNTNSESNEFNFQIAVNISYLRLMRNWYETTDSPYAIFCDDDISFLSIDYWNFTWQKFVDRLPKNWEAVQLIRMRRDLVLEGDWHKRVNPTSNSFKLLPRRNMPNNAGGSVYFMTREYVSKVLNRYIVNEKFDFTPKGDDIIPGISSCEDTFLFGKEVYNIPLFFEDCSLKSTILHTYPYLEMDESRKQFYKRVHNNSQDFYTYFWKTYGPIVSLNTLMENF